MSITEYNGSAIVAMAGKNCVAIAADRRFGVQGLTLGIDYQKIFRATDKTYIGLAGLASDVMTLNERLRFKVNMYHLNEEREITPKTYAHLVSSTLYEKRFGPYFIDPVIAGLDKENKPFVCSSDLIGCLNVTTDFVVAGTASDQLNGICEALWEPDLEPEDLFETISQAILNAVDRNAISGWGGIVHVITPTEVITRTLRGRMD